MKTRKAGELVMDFSIYPRGDVDRQHVSYIREAMAAGRKMPPLIVDAKSLRVVDGFHRLRAHLLLSGPDYEIDVIEKRYDSERDLFADAIRYNADHGVSLSRYDRVHCLLVGEKIGLNIEVIADAMGMTIGKLKELRVERVGKIRVVGAAGEPMALKRTISHMQGRTLTKEQGDANDKLGGMNQLFYVNQLILLIENDLLDTGNEDLMDGLRSLARLIRGLPAENPRKEKVG